MHVDTDTDRSGVLLAQEIDRLTGQTWDQRRWELDRRIDARVLELARAAYKPDEKPVLATITPPEPATPEKRMPSKPSKPVSRGRMSRKTRKPTAPQKRR